MEERRGLCPAVSSVHYMGYLKKIVKSEKVAMANAIKKILTHVIGLFVMLFHG